VGNTATATVGTNVLHAEIDTLVMIATPEMHLSGRIITQNFFACLTALDRLRQVPLRIYSLLEISWKRLLQGVCSSELWVYPCSAGAYIACNLFPDKKHVKQHNQMNSSVA